MSLRNRIYYRWKPILPLPIRYALRRVRANYKLATTTNWPISPSSATPPADWPGWPDGKQFAFVLTHDVETQVGSRRAFDLACLELRLGFVSSFNFVPEGGYRSALLRDNLASEGFEIGVHDLRHDGALFRSRPEFSVSAEKINRYLAEWGAVGFRAGFMFHNLEWINDLNIEYDASTFDTDPFEAQPDGMDTIFPFWVKGPTGRRYVELPYTLAQDSTLFFILREKTIDLWKKKIDWIAQNGGMALMNVHPDYISFDRERIGRSEYPASLYAEFLSYVRDRYAGQFWQPLPRDLARYFKAATAPKAQDVIAQAA